MLVEGVYDLSDVTLQGPEEQVCLALREGVGAVRATAKHQELREYTPSNVVLIPAYDRVNANVTSAARSHKLHINKPFTGRRTILIWICVARKYNIALIVKLDVSENVL